MHEYLEAPNGFLYTNGEVYGSAIYLAEGVNKDNFYLIPVEEYEEKLRLEAESSMM